MLDDGIKAGDMFTPAEDTILVDSIECIMGEAMSLKSGSAQGVFLFTFEGNINGTTQRSSVTVALRLDQAGTIVDRILEGMQRYLDVTEG